MPRTNLSMSISADGYVAGPDQSEDNPIGIGGMALHHWHLGPAQEHPVNRQVVSDMLDGMGATIMGRNMFGPIRGEWSESEWKGWWGDNPPYHCPVFVHSLPPRPNRDGRRNHLSLRHRRNPIRLRSGQSGRW
jgi:dihydrofolate reductase